MMKRFKRQSDLIKHAVQRVIGRQEAEQKEFKRLRHGSLDFLQRCAMKAKGIR